VDESKHKRALTQITQSEAARRQFDLVWAECDDYTFGLQKLYRDWDGSLKDATQLRPETRYVRDRFNLIKNRVLREHASYTALSPTYRVSPALPVGASASEVGYQSAVKAATNAERQLDHFDQELSLASVKARAKMMTLVFGEGYVWVDYDPSQGQQIPGTNKRIGKATVRNLAPTQVVWGIGQRFEESGWHAVQWFPTEEEAKTRWPEHADKIRANATAHNTQADAILDSGHGKANLVSAWEYFERPNPNNPKGCHYTFVGGECVREEEYPYDFEETNSEPWLVRYFYVQPERKSRAEGFVVDLIDSNRAYNRRENTLTEWWGIAANPMLNIPRYINETQDADTIYPGKRWVKSPTGEGIEYVQPPSLPEWIASAPEKTKAGMDSISGQYDFANVASYSSPGSIEQIRQQDQNRQGEVARQFDRSDAAMARRLLLLARKNYTEPRNVTYNSKTGEQTMEDFVASQGLPKPLNVKITSGVPATPAQNAAMITTWMQMGAITPPEGILAIQENSPEMITEPFKLNISLQQDQNRQILEMDDEEIAPIVQKFAALAAKAAEQGVDISQASPPPGPWPHATEFENQDVCMRIMENWFMTPEYRMMGKPRQQIAMWLYQERKLIKMADATRQAQLDAAQAEQMGAANATRPTSEKPMPSQPSVESNMPKEAQPA
jgi:hypothetical protein